MRARIEAVYREERARVLATLTRLLGDLDLAEDALQGAIASAIEQWPTSGIPENPRAWLISAGRFRAIDALRKETRLYASLTKAAARHEPLFPDFDPTAIPDDRLRLIFACCHPALPAMASAALTLREVCGLSTEEIASAFLSSPATVAQRIVRAKAKIRQEHLSFELPAGVGLADRLDSALRVTYLLFSEGYYASRGDSLIQDVLSQEAIRLARLIVDLHPEPEAIGLLALLLLLEARRSARATADGDLILLRDQDPRLWDRALIAEAISLLGRAHGPSGPGFYALQASIAATHADGVLRGATDWSRIVGLYDALLAQVRSPVIELNRAVAVSYLESQTEAALTITDRLIAESLAEYVPAWATRADLLRRLGRVNEAREAYERVIRMSQQAAERRFFQARLQSLDLEARPEESVSEGREGDE